MCAVEVTAPGEPLLPGGEAFLPARDLRLRRQPVLGEVELGARLQDPTQLRKRALDIGDRAQRHRRERTVEAIVGQVEARAVESGRMHRDR